MPFKITLFVDGSRNSTAVRLMTFYGKITIQVLLLHPNDLVTENYPNHSSPNIGYHVVTQFG